MTLNSAVTDTSWSPNISTGRPDGPADHIVIHHWGADGQSHQGVVDYLCAPSNHGASAHYVASGGRVTQLVHDYDRAWHAGPSGNPRGLGIECRPECSQADFETVAALVAAIRHQHGHLPIVGHRDHMPTDCPGRWYQRLADLDQRARQIQAGESPTPTPHQEETMTPDQATQLANTSWLIANALAPAIGRIEQRTWNTEAQVTALTAAVKVLSASQGLDPDAVAKSISAAVHDALAGLQITLTTQEATK